jgi:hypothetical protein
MTPADARLRAIHQSWHRWCSSAAPIGTLAVPATNRGDASSVCIHVPVADGKDSRGWKRYVCERCGRFYGYLPPDVAGVGPGG